MRIEKLTTLILLAGLVVGLGSVSAVHATAIVVDTTGDVIGANSGGCAGMSISSLSGPDGKVSLRETMCAANNTPGPDDITFANLAVATAVAEVCLV